MENTLLNQALQEEVTEGFKIENLEGAVWAFRKLRAIEAKKAEIKSIADEERARIDLWEKEEIRQYEVDKEYFEGLLSFYYVEERTKDKKFKLSTPYGKVSSRKDKKWIYEEEQLIDYLEMENPEGVRIKKEVDKTYIKKKYKEMALIKKLEKYYLM